MGLCLQVFDLNKLDDDTYNRFIEFQTKLSERILQGDEERSRRYLSIFDLPLERGLFE